MYSNLDKSIQDISMIIVKKRERTQNWAPEEKNVLLSLIKPQINAIENKKIDAAASALKTQAWNQIHTAFKGRFSTDRDITRIKEQWRRMKAQTKSEMVTFAERVRIDPEEAVKCRPSALSLEIWRLLEAARKAEEGDRSDESSEETGTASLLNLLDKYAVVPVSSELGTAEIKQEVYSDMDNETNVEEGVNGYPEYQRKRNLGENSGEKSSRGKRKRNRTDRRQSRANNVDIHEEDIEEEAMSDNSQAQEREAEEEAVQSSMFLFKAAQVEHKMKVHMLEIEIQRAELQKQAAFNDLKSSEIKREMIETQANEYYKLKK